MVLQHTNVGVVRESGIATYECWCSEREWYCNIQCTNVHATYECTNVHATYEGTNVHNVFVSLGLRFLSVEG